MENEILQNKEFSYIAIAVCAVALTVTAWGLTKLWTILIETVGRNPQAKKDVSLFGFVGMGSIETVALYIFVLAIMLIK